MKILVKAKTNAAIEHVEEIDDASLYFPNKTSSMKAYAVSVKGLPIKGFANKAIIVLLSKHLKIAPSLIKIVSGSKSKFKIFEISI